MAIYVKRESAIADTIQSPGDVGNDLNQIEKDIAGPKGISAHEEEIEDAVSGVIDDPAKGLMDGSEIAEATYMSLYESEYNFNQIIECLDVHTLNAASMDRELVLEASDIKGFFTKVKEAIMSAFRSFTEIITNALNKIKSVFLNNKKFVNENKAAIEKGFGKMANRNDQVMGLAYDHNGIQAFASKMKSFDNEGKKIDSSFDLNDATVDLAKQNRANASDADSAMDAQKKEIIKFFTNDAADVTSIGDLTRWIESSIVGKEKVDLRTHYKSANELISILLSDSGKSVSDDYAVVKRSINDRIKKLDEAARKADANSAEANQLKFAANACKYYQQALQSVATVITRLRTNEIMQARKYANMCVTASGQTYKESAYVSSNENSVFAGITLI